MKQSATERVIAVLQNKLNLDDSGIEFLKHYVWELEEWNRRVNLVSRTDMNAIWTGHILHSYAPLMYVSLSGCSRLLDIGSGGGLPGIPIAILYPEISVTLLDSIRKKVDAVKAIVETLGLANVTVVNGRAEEIGRRVEYAHMFDVVTARAVAPLVDLIKYSRPFLKHSSNPQPGGSVHPPMLLAWKGGDLSAEIAGARAKYGLRSVSVIDLDMPLMKEYGLEEKKAVVVEME